MKGCDLSLHHRLLRQAACTAGNTEQHIKLIKLYNTRRQLITRKRCTGQVLPSAKYRPMRLVVDAALRRIGKSRHGGHKIANISLNCQRI